MTFPATATSPLALRLETFRARLRTARGREKARLLVELGRLLAHS